MVSKLVLYLHQLADEEGRIEVDDALASNILQALRGGEVGSEESAAIADELTNGPVLSVEAKAIRNAALRQLINYTLFLRSVDTLGYTVQLLRSALSTHYEMLTTEPLGSDGNCILLDIDVAYSKLTAPLHQQVVRLLMDGLGPQEIGEQLSTNGSRLVGRVLKQMSDTLEGTHLNGTKKQSKPRSSRRGRTDSK